MLEGRREREGERGREREGERAGERGREGREVREGREGREEEGKRGGKRGEENRCCAFTAAGEEYRSTVVIVVVLGAPLSAIYETGRPFLVKCLSLKPRERVCALKELIYIDSKFKSFTTNRVKIMR